MPNGQFHGKAKGPAIRIKNPLGLTVEVHIIDGKGFSTVRTLRPGNEVYVKVPHPGDYDINPKIIKYDATGQEIYLGDAGWQQTHTVSAKPNTAPQAGPVLTAGQKTVKSRRWVNIAEWIIPKGFIGGLRATSIRLSGDCEALFCPPHVTPQPVLASTTIQSKVLITLKSGEAVKVKARALLGNPGSVNVMIQGVLSPVGTPVPAGKVSKRAPEHITEQKPKKEPEEEPLRSLGDMIEEMRKREEVKV